MCWRAVKRNFGEKKMRKRVRGSGGRPKRNPLMCKGREASTKTLGKKITCNFHWMGRSCDVTLIAHRETLLINIDFPIRKWKTSRNHAPFLKYATLEAFETELSSWDSRSTTFLFLDGILSAFCMEFIRFFPFSRSPAPVSPFLFTLSRGGGRDVGKSGGQGKEKGGKVHIWRTQ